MPKYVYDKENDRMVDKQTGEPMIRPGSNLPPQAPRVFGDLPGYQSPIDGKWVDGRRDRRYDLESNNCVDANDIGPPSGGRLKNKAFMKKHSLEHLER